MRVPAKVVAGDSVQWTDEPFADDQGRAIAPSSHSLAFAFRGPSAEAKVDVTSATSGGFFSTSLSSVQTAAFNTTSASVVWYWQAFATEGDGDRYGVGSGTMLVTANLMTLAGDVYDGRSQAQRDLEAVRAAITARTNGGLVLSYTIGSRNLQKEPIAALLALESRLAQRVARERAAQAIANGRGNPSKSYVRFGSRGY